jgi:dTDP-4-dehydrorhamnose 3,5-epimerase
LIQGVAIRELSAGLDKAGLSVEIWEGNDIPASIIGTHSRLIFPGVVEAWVLRESATERIICLAGMIKLVLCDRREGSDTRDEVGELFLGEYRLREVIVPPGILRGWKAVGDRSALVLLVLEGDESRFQVLTPEEAEVPYDWEIVMQ